MRVRIQGLYVGRPRPMPGDGRATAIFKQAVDAALTVTAAGLAGDVQADLRVHGGPDKALHHFPSDHYARLVRAVPDLAGEFVAGAIGENISTAGITEADVCIGDVFALGTAQVQLSQPRTPCWKIDKKFGVEGLARAIAIAGIAGWYYRVLAPGTVAPGDELRLLERNRVAFPVARMWALGRALRPEMDELEALAATPGLAAQWRQRIRDRAAWLRREQRRGADGESLAPSPR
ncbi:MAG: MOSC domain-containing protein [Gammaproteobacteria bacterium]|nr:MOSC domain-containing protein [Gammaproteobacteria bacterium]